MNPVVIANPLEGRSRHAAALPRQLYIEVTNRCNSLCKSCPLTYDHFLEWEPKHHLSFEQFRAIVDQVPVIQRAVLHGIGEPLMNPELPRIIAHLKERGSHVLFNTNAVLLDQTRGDAVVAAGLDELRVSLDALTPSLYAHLRGIDKLPRILNNLRAYTARRRERASAEARQPKLSLWFVGMRENLHELIDVVRFAIEIGAPEVHLQRLVYFGDGERLDDAVTAAAEQSLHAALERQQEQLIHECEALAQRARHCVFGIGRHHTGRVARSQRQIALAGLPPPVVADVYHRDRHGPAMLHRAVCRDGLSRASCSATCWSNRWRKSGMATAIRRCAARC